MDHHPHAHEASADNERRTLIALTVTGGFMVIEAAGGWLSGSLALLADATHMLTDALGLALTWATFRLSRLSPDPLRSYGYRRAEVLAALANGLAVVVLAVWIVYEAAGRMAAPRPVLGWPMIAVALTGLAVNVFVLRLLRGAHDHDNINMRGAILHVIGDLLGSAAAVIAAAAILTTGLTIIDPILSVAVALLILVNAWRLVKAATHILLEGAPEGFDEAQLRTGLIAAVPGLADVHHIHAWSLTAGKPLVTLHATIGAEGDHDRTLAAIKLELGTTFGITHSVVQVERKACPDRSSEGG